MRLAMPHGCSVIATSVCDYYTLSRSVLLNITKERPDIAFQLQSALGLTIFEADKAAGRKHGTKGKINFLAGVRNRFKVAIAFFFFDTTNCSNPYL